jgi:Zn-dependent protease with chaperone function
MDDQLIVSCEADSRHVFTRSELKIATKVGSIPREVTLPDRNLLSIPSNPQINQWLDGKQSSTVSAMERSTLWRSLSIALVPISLYSMFKFLVPALAIGFAAYVPDKLINLASEHTLVVLDKTILDETTLEQSVQDKLQLEWQRLVAQLRLNPKKYRLHFRQSEEMGANAFALPDGTVVVTDGLVELFDHSMLLLNPILLHEIGHVEQMHSMRFIAETLITSIAVSYFVGDIGPFAEFFVGISNTVLQNQFSQKLEWEADNFALAQMQHLDMHREHFA